VLCLPLAILGRMFLRAVDQWVASLSKCLQSQDASLRWRVQSIHLRVTFPQRASRGLQLSSCQSLAGESHDSCDKE
jgi:hypothetical protein